MQQYPITTPKGDKVLKDTTFFFSATPAGGVAIEAQTPGTLREQQSLLLGEFVSPMLTYAVFDLFMGQSAIDPVARIDIGACVLYFANGFTMEDDPNNPHQWRPGDELKGQQVEVFEPRVEMFNLPYLGKAQKAQDNPLLIKGIRVRRALKKSLLLKRQAEAQAKANIQ